MKKKRTKFRPGALWTTPSVILLLCLTILPLLMLLVFSFMNRNIFAGQPWPGWTLRNITRMFGSATFWRLMGFMGGATGIVDRGLIVHRDPDDYSTQPTGNSGPGIACAVITRADLSK